MKNRNIQLKKSAFFLIIGLGLISCTSTNNQVSNVSTTEKVQTEDSIQKIQILENRTFKNLKLVKVFQAIIQTPKDPLSVWEPAINSPKSATYSKDGSKFYINSLEGYTTVVFDAKSLQKVKEIRHEFNESNKELFKNGEFNAFDYTFKQQRKDYNTFLGKPVESCLSHNGKFLWVTYYRRDWDPKAESPSAIAIINTETDEIVRVMPAGPLPKMIACAPDNKSIAVTHWGDNTVGLIDISSDEVMDFSYTSHIVVDNRLSMNFSATADRDSECGNCLRGTVFTPDGKKILIAKMGGTGIAVIDVETKKYEGTIVGSYNNLRHIVIVDGYLMLSSNKFGIVQKAKLEDIFAVKMNADKQIIFKDWKTIEVGPGARTIDVTEDGRTIFACVNNACKIVVIDAATMTKIAEVDAAKFPVGMALSPDGNQLVTTSQGKDAFPNSGNTVMVFEVEYEETK